MGEGKGDFGEIWISIKLIRTFGIKKYFLFILINLNDLILIFGDI